MTTELKEKSDELADPTTALKRAYVSQPSTTFAIFKTLYFSKSELVVLVDLVRVLEERCRNAT